MLSPDLDRNVDLGLVLVTDRLQTIYDLNLLSLLTLSLMLVPISIGVSVARHQLFDMDLLLNRAIVYGILTGVIAVALFGSVAIVGGLVVNRFGRGLGIAMTGVLMIAAFQPLRSRIQSQVDRRFYREKYDADRTVEAFAQQIRDEADLHRLEEGLLSMVDGTLRPQHADVYLGRDSDRHRAAHVALTVEYLDQPNRPIVTSELAYRSGPLRELSAAGAVIVLPLVSHRQLVGVLVLGSRLGERSYSGLDHDLLHRLGEIVAPAFRFAELAERHAQEAVEKQRYEQELQLARSIQRDLLPKQLPDLAGWQLTALYEPAREVGGDLYDFIELPLGRWAVIVADVTDKGVPAAMVMATCRSMLRGVAISSDGPGPGEVLRRVNDLLIADTPENMFVTCFFAVLDPGGGLTYANAGHCLPLRWSDSVAPVEARGMPLGLMQGMQYDEGTLELAPGQGVLFYSDGVTEARDPDGDMYGTARFQAWWRAGR